MTPLLLLIGFLIMMVIGLALYIPHLRYKHQEHINNLILCREKWKPAPSRRCLPPMPVPERAPNDFTCLVHGMKMSEHPPWGCLYCCICFQSLTPEECSFDSNGRKQDICQACAEIEKAGQ